jgi:hypothetical protein
VFPPDKFNAGVIVCCPDAAVFDDMVTKARDKLLTSYDGGDTGFLNACVNRRRRVSILLYYYVLVACTAT